MARAGRAAVGRHDPPGLDVRAAADAVDPDRPRLVVLGGRPGERRPSTNPVPRRRTAYFLAAMGALAMALMSGIDRYDTTLFSIHMVQHILLILVSAPLLALAAPVTLPAAGEFADTRRRWILPVLHSTDRPGPDPPDRRARILFAAVMWVSHFSPLFDAGPRGPLDPRPGARPVPDGRAAVLVARRRARPGAVRMGHPGRLTQSSCR